MKRAMAVQTATPGSPIRLAYPTELRNEVDAYLAALQIPVDPEAEGLADAMRYSLDAGGKRFRAVLSLATARVLELDHRSVLPLAAAIELVHTQSLIHDDLPAMDDDDLRRGKPSNHRVFGEGVAVLAGDALLAEAFRLVLSEMRAPPDRVVRAVCRLARAIAAEGMAAGQYLDLEGRATDERAVLRMHRLKTGMFLEASVLSVVDLVRPEPSAANALALYAGELGVLFQIVDDILDVNGSSAETGKTAGSDQRNGRSTLTRGGDTTRAERIADGCMERIAEALATLAGDSGELYAIAHFARHRRA